MDQLVVFLFTMWRFGFKKLEQSARQNAAEKFRQKKLIVKVYGL